MQLNDDEKKFLRLAESIKNKNKIRDVGLVYELGYKLKLDDEKIGNVIKYAGL